MGNPSRYTKKDWKAKLYDYDRAITTPTGSALYCLSDQEVELLLANVEYLRWPTRYYSPTQVTIDPSKILYIANEIERSLMSSSCGCGGGCSCQSSNALDVLVSIEYARQDAETPGSYAPNMPDTAYDQSTVDTTSEAMTQRGQALCLAVDQYVNRIIQEMILRGQAAGAVLSVLGGLVSVFLPMAGFVISVIGGGLIALVESLDNNEQAIKDVKCCMLNGLKGVPITEANFALALGACGFSFGSDEAQLSAIVNANNQDSRNFRAFNVLLGTAFPSVGEDNCAFCDEGWCYLLDFTTDDFSDIVKISAPDTSAGAGYIAGTGYHAPTGEQILIYVNLPPTSFLTDYATRHGTPDAAFVQTYNRDGTVLTFATLSVSGWAVQNHLTDVDAGKVDERIQGGTITKLFIKGRGVDPFNSSNCDGTLPYP